ncbi:MAG: LamG domain-containing protein [Bacteroidota bacterium]
MQVQLFTLSGDGIENISTEKLVAEEVSDQVLSSPLIVDNKVKPVLWWKFDEGSGDNTSESINEVPSEVAGNKTLWRPGVSGTSLQLDGYISEIRYPSDLTNAITDEITIEGWVAIGAYPWSYVPLVQQMDDNLEELIAKKGNEVVLLGKEGREEYEESEGGWEPNEEDFDFVMKEEDDRGFFLGLDGYGKPVFKLRVGGKWQQLVAENVLERTKWYHLTSTFDNAAREMAIYLDGKLIARKQVQGAGPIELSNNDIRLGKGKERRPIRPVRDNTFSDSYSLDGLIDEVKIYNIAKSSNQINRTYRNYLTNEDALATVAMDSRVLPDGENRGKFGSYYTHLRFYDTWDNLWRFSDHPDVVVEFDDNPSKFIFWRGVGYIPMMVNDQGQWYSNEFNETWNRSGGEGCQEPMSDKESYNNHVRIIENTPARTVVHWRYPLVDVKHVMANYDKETGWCDWSDWYYYIYPDGLAVKSMKLWTHGERDHEWQESMAIFGPNQHPEQIINKEGALSMLNLSGDIDTYHWIEGPPDNVDEPKDQKIQYINYTGVYKPVTVGDFQWSDVYGGELTEYAVFPTWNHWPVAQMPSDGRYATYPDRTSHSSLTHVGPSIYREVKDGPTPYYEKLLMEGMLNESPEELVPIARSWMNAPKMTILNGADGRYDPSQRAYVLSSEDNEDINLEIQASEEQPLINTAFVVKGWGSNKNATISMNNQPVDVKQGITRDIDGSKTLLIWIEHRSMENTSIGISKS